MMGLTTTEISIAMRNRFRLNEGYAVIEEVGNSTGHRCNRHADAIVMNLWPSRGLELMGFEYKASRSDWVKELKDPGKADPIFQYCDRWYLVVGDPAIVKPGELPATWGLMVPQKMTAEGDWTLRDANGADKLKPVALDKSFVAAMLRAAAKSSATPKALEAARQEGRRVGYKEGQATGEYVGKSAMRHLEELTASVSAFEKASGIAITRYTNGTELGEAVKFARELTGRHDSIESLLLNSKRNGEAITARSDELLAALSAVRDGDTANVS